MAALVGLDPAAVAGQRFDLTNGHFILGRSGDSGLRLDDQHVSRQHAALTVRGDRVWVEDMGSVAGTLVNGHPVHRRHELHDGDIVTLAIIHLRYDAEQEQARFDLRDQRAGVINNVGRDQIHYIQHRDSLLRDIAAAKTRGRWLIIFGFTVTLVGFAMFAAGVLDFIRQISGMVNSSRPPTEIPSPIGADIFGVPSGLLGWVLAAIGSVLIIIGIVQHVVAAARRRRVDREVPSLRAATRPRRRDRR